MGSLFAGIGGFEYGATLAGIMPLWSVEIDPYCCKVLNKNFNHKIYEKDIRAIETIETVDIVCAGFPCQPFSSAGNRKGESDDRFIWSEVCRICNIVRPKWVIAENVSGIRTLEKGRTLSSIKGSLANRGYEVTLFDIPAFVSGLQTMERHIWIIAEATGFRCKGSKEKPDSLSAKQREFQGANKEPLYRRDLSKTRFCRVGERVSARLDRHQRHRLKALGNAVPPGIVYCLFKIIMDYEKQKQSL